MQKNTGTVFAIQREVRALKTFVGVLFAIGLLCFLGVEYSMLNGLLSYSLGLRLAGMWCMVVPLGAMSTVQKLSKAGGALQGEVSQSDLQQLEQLRQEGLQRLGRELMSSPVMILAEYFLWKTGYLLVAYLVCIALYLAYRLFQQRLARQLASADGAL